ncbi:fibronectin type III domain-containing protein [Modestobacter sp. URMC 112]
MRPPSPSRRAAGLLTAAAVGLSTAVLGVPGVAAAADPLQPFTFSTVLGAADVHTPEELTKPYGYCRIDWVVAGGAGGRDSDGVAGGPGGRISVSVPVDFRGGDVFRLHPGAAGGDATPAADPTVDTGSPGAGGTNGRGDDGLTGAERLTAGASWYYGGGGGAASTVTQATKYGELLHLQAFGGDGAGALPGDPAGTGSGAGENRNETRAPGVEDLSTSSEGAVGGTVVPCAPAPAAPSVSGAPMQSATEVVVDFWPAPVAADSPLAPVTGWEVKLNDGTWNPWPTTGSGQGRHSFTLTGLHHQRDHSVQVRAMSDSGPGAASNVVTFHRGVAPPADVAARVGTSSVTVTWEPPAGATGIRGYRVTVLPGAEPRDDAGRLECPPLGADARSCTIGVPAGQVYSVSVAADDGSPGFGASVVTGVVPGPATPATVPPASAPLSVDGADRTVAAGEEVTVRGTGYLPNSSVDVLLYSTPQVLTTVVADGTGAFTATVTVPSGLADGTHHLVAAGVDADGAPRYLVTEVTVAGGVAAAGPAGSTALAAVGGSRAAMSRLADTGATVLPIAGGGLVTLLAGGGLLLAVRRRREV